MEGPTHGAPTWFVRGRRSFAKFVDPRQHRVDDPHVAIWMAAPPGVRHELPAADPARFFAPRLGGSDWVGMRLDLDGNGPDWVEVEELLTDAYRQVAPKTLAARLAPPPDPRPRPPRPAIAPPPPRARPPRPATAPGHRARPPRPAVAPRPPRCPALPRRAPPAKNTVLARFRPDPAGNAPNW